MSYTNQGERLIFVAGAPRSGTTMIQNILDSHPDIFAGPEFDRIPNIIDLRRKLHASITTARIDLFCSREGVDNAIASFIEQLLLPVADKNGSRFLSEKTPWNILVFVDLIEIFPRARFIHVVRDPRAVISSMLQVGAKARSLGKDSPDFTRKIGLAMHYVESCHRIASEASNKAPDRFLTVVYEHMIADGEKETKKICWFLNVEWSEQMLSPSTKRHAGENNLVDIWYEKQMFLRDPESSEIDKWKKQLNPLHAVLISEAFRSNQDLVKFGYDFSIEVFPKWARVLGSQYYKILRRKYGYETAKLRLLG